METLPFPEFRSVVIETVSELTERGYQLSSVGHVNDLAVSTGYHKLLDPSTMCEISFQLLPYEEPFGFKVNLYRRPSSEDAVSRYCHLGIDLWNLMKGFFEIDPFPPGVFHWEFVHEQSLRTQIIHAQSLILKYGIPWLEDPLSNVDWVKKRRDT